ncbi:hypothetical protein ACHWQZ_G002546 [Mnemiopsis leidyi]
MEPDKHFLLQSNVVVCRTWVEVPGVVIFLHHRAESFSNSLRWSEATTDYQQLEHAWLNRRGTTGLLFDKQFQPLSESLGRSPSSISHYGFQMLDVVISDMLRIAGSTATTRLASNLSATQ